MGNTITMADIIPLLGLPYPPSGRSSYYIPCPCCDDGSRKKHLNINLKKNVFRCPRCGFYGGVFDLYAYYMDIPRDSVREAILSRLGLEPTLSVRVEPEVLPDCPLADAEIRHNTYSAMLSKLSLASDHRQNLLSRGLPLEEIDRLGYKTTPVMGMSAIAKQLQSDGYYLLGVPGFYRKDGCWTFVSLNRGILIPVRNMNGQILGLQIRRDNATHRKFRWVSSVDRPDGCGAECWVHVAGAARSTVILIEGPMKADIVRYHTGQTVVAVAGVSSLSQLEPVLIELRESGVTRIMTAFDMDFLKNPHVQNGYMNLTQLLSKTGFTYGTYLWDTQFNGLDDYIWLHCMGGQSSQ